jgi:hypothetical protein
MALIKEIVTWGSALFALVAALLWAFASFQKVRALSEEGLEKRFRDSLIPMQIIETNGNVDILDTAARQTYWNGWAALAASIAAILQALSLIL